MQLRGQPVESSGQKENSEVAEKDVDDHSLGERSLPRLQGRHSTIFLLLYSTI